MSCYDCVNANKQENQQLNSWNHVAGWNRAEAIVTAPVFTHKQCLEIQGLTDI